MSAVQAGQGMVSLLPAVGGAAQQHTVDAQTRQGLHQDHSSSLIGCPNQKIIIIIIINVTYKAPNPSLKVAQGAKTLNYQDIVISVI